MKKQLNKTMKFDKELLVEVLGISAPSGNEDEAQNYVDEWVRKNIPDALIDMDAKGNIYVTKGKAVSYPTFVGHLDDVHDYYQYKTIHEMNGWLYAMDAKEMEQVGTAGDDKVGMYLCLEALRTYDAVKCFFPVEEEWGTVGTSDCDMTFFDDSAYVIQSDRQRAEDIVVATYGGKMTSAAFDKVAVKAGKQYGYSLCNTGGLTDVVTLKDRGLEVCAINIASGYYKPHQEREVVRIADVAKMIATVGDMVIGLGDKVWQHKKKKRKEVRTYDYNKDWGQTTGAVPKGWSSKAYESSFKRSLLNDTKDYNSPHKEHKELYYCEDCNKEITAEDMATQDLCKECTAWYMDEYDIDTNKDVSPNNDGHDNLYW